MTPTNTPAGKAEEPSGTATALTGQLLSIVRRHHGAENAIALATEFRVAVTAQVAKLERELAEAKHLLSVAQSANAEIMHGMSSQLADAESERDTLGIEVAKLREALNRVLTLIPRDFDTSSGVRGIVHDEQPDSPGGFLACDIDELIETIIAHVEKALSNPATPNLVAIDRDELEELKSAREQLRRYSTVKASDYVKCPVCGEPDMRKWEDAEGNAIIFCTNHACTSNGGSNHSAIDSTSGPRKGTT
jgi:hypothetical protein